MIGKLSLLLILTCLSSLLMIGCNNKEEQYNSNSYKEMDINPISKETVISILRAEYGDGVVVSEDDIKTEGDNYIVDVLVEIEDNEEHDEYTDIHIHTQSLGIHKINMYTGKIVE